MPSLLSKITIGDMSLDNRVVMAPLTRARLDERGIPDELTVKYYTQRATAGLLITEATGISQEGQLWPNAPRLYNKDHIEGWKDVTSAVHSEGGKIFCQLWHMGRAGHSEVSGMPIVAPSPIPMKAEVNGLTEKKKPEVPHELTAEEIAVIVEDFGKAAENAIEAGFDGVELHFANGYLGDQFLQSISNTRTDRYGGSVEKRLTFLKEVLDRVLASLPASKVGIRFSPNGAFSEMGSADNLETFSAAIEEVAKRELVYVHVLDGLGFGFHQLSEPMTLAMVREIINAVDSTTAVMGNVGYTKETAEERIESGDADLIAFGRPFISNPDLVRRFRENLELNPDAEYPTWWTTSLGEKGYTDWKTVDEIEEEKAGSDK